MSKLWAVDHEMLERNGEFQTLIHIFGSFPLINLPDRAQAALARAYAFSGDTQKAEVLITRLLDSTQGEARIVALLARAHLERLVGCWPQAEKTATLAFDEASALGFIALQADAEFGIAIAWVEQDRLFKGLDTFQRLRNNPLLSDYRRGLAASNEGWLLWHLGRFETLEQALPFVPSRFQPRLVLAQQMVKGSLELTEKWMRDGLPAFLPQQEKEHCALLLTQSVLTLGYDRLRSDFASSWLASYWKEQRAESKNPLMRGLGERVCRSLGEPGRLTQPSALHWRETLNLRWMEALIEKQEDRSVSLFWRRELNPLIEQYQLRSPLIPLLTDRGFEPRSPWSEALEERLCIRAKSTDKKVLSLKSGRLYWGKPDPTHLIVDLSRQPTSLKLLRILAGRAGDRIGKDVIHQGLTGTRYIPSRHDDRILKLLRRLKRKFDERRMPEPWTWNGDHKVQLQTDIEIL